MEPALLLVLLVALQGPGPGPAPKLRQRQARQEARSAARHGAATPPLRHRGCWWW